MRSGARRATWWVAAACFAVVGCAGDGQSSTSRVPETEGSVVPMTEATRVPGTDATVVPTPSSAAMPRQPPTIDALLARGEPLAIAHQGGDTVYPSSTLFAYGEAVRHGVDMLELDVHLSADGELVVIHDDTVDRTTEGTGSVAEMTAPELAALDAAHDFMPDCDDCPRPNGRPFPYRGMRTGDRPVPSGYAADDFAIPTLRQVVERFPQMPLDIEIKDGVDTVRPLVAELRALDRADSTVVVSFDQRVVDAFRAAAPDIAVSPAEDALVTYAGGGELDGYRIVQVPPAFGDVDVLELVGDRLRRDSIAVWVWMNEAEQESNEFYRALIADGVDGLIIGRSDLAGDVFQR